MAAPKFVLGANELQFSRGIRYPVEKPHEKLQAMDRTAGGGLQVEELGIDIRTRRLIFKNLPQVDYDALCTWYDTIADGSLNTFTYYDEDGVSMTVRMLTNPLNFAETYYQRFSGELLLEVVN
jgi:hypothetical protein